jgi:hypothetical protein
MFKKIEKKFNLYKKSGLVSPEYKKSVQKKYMISLIFILKCRLCYVSRLLNYLRLKAKGLLSAKTEKGLCILIVHYCVESVQKVPHVVIANNRFVPKLQAK